MATPTPAKTDRMTSSPDPACGTAAVKNQLMGIEAIIASPPQLVVTSAARSVLPAESRAPERLLRMYSAGSGMPHASPAASVHRSPLLRIACVPCSRPIVIPYVVVPSTAVRPSASQTHHGY